jgi:hypothetical protein
MFSSILVGGSVTFSALDDRNISRTFAVRRTSSATAATIFSTYACSGGVRVRYGSGSRSPVRSDSRLDSEIYVDGSPKLVIDESRGFVLVQSDVIFSSSVTICEVGLSLYGTVAGYDVCGEFYLIGLCSALVGVFLLILLIRLGIVFSFRGGLGCLGKN